MNPPKLTTQLLKLYLPPGGVGDSILGDLREEFTSFRPAILRGIWYRWICYRMVAGYALDGLRQELATFSFAELRASLVRDVRYAFRTFASSPGFTAAAVLTLVVGIGANTAIFSLIDAAMLRPLPYEAPEELVLLNMTSEDTESKRVKRSPWWSYPKYELLRDHVTTFERIAAYSDTHFNLTSTDQPHRLAAESVSATYFKTLGIDAASGRTFRPEEDAEPGAHPVAVMGHGLWNRLFGGDPGILGEVIRLGETSVTVVGIMPPGFQGLTGNAEIWVPMAMVPTLSNWDKALTWHGTHWHHVVARLLPGRTLARANHELESFGPALTEAFPRREVRSGVAAVALDSARVTPTTRISMWILFAAVATVLVIGCVNIASLLLTRATTRQRELSIRLAVGASRGRLILQLLTESLLLSLVGGLGALGLARVSVDALSGLIPSSMSHLFDGSAMALGGRVILFTLAASLLTGLCFGLVPAIRAARVNLVDALKGAGGAMTSRVGGLGRGPIRTNLLVSGQIALAIVLLIGASLMLKSFARLQNVETGFSAENVLTLRLEPNLSEPMRVNRIHFKRRLLEHLSTIPGVEHVSLSNCTPLSSQCWTTNVSQVDGVQIADNEQLIGVQYIGTEHFKTLGIPVLSGRGFDSRDTETGPLTIVLNETAARTLWPGQDPIGRRMAIGESVFLDAGSAEVVGIVGDVHYGDPSEPHRPDAYLSAMVGGPGRLQVLVRTAGDPLALIPALRSAVLTLDSQLPIYDVQTMAERSAASTEASRFLSILLASFAGVALLLSALGLYGAIGYRVSRQTRELGLRIALGETAQAAVRRAVWAGVRVSLVGMGCGLLVAVGVTRVLSTLLFEVSTMDPWTFAGVAVFLGIVSTLASYLPARRVIHIDPITVLRED